MTGQSHWIALVPIVLGGIGIAWLMWRDRIAERRYEIEQRRFLAPCFARRSSHGWCEIPARAR